MKAAGVPDWYIGSCKKIAYLFPKAHAVAMLMMAFRIALVQVHRPLAFYAAISPSGRRPLKALCAGMMCARGKLREIVAKDKGSTAVEAGHAHTWRCAMSSISGLPSSIGWDVYQSEAIRFAVDEERGTLRPPSCRWRAGGDGAAISLAEQRVGRSLSPSRRSPPPCPKVSKTHIQLLERGGAFGDLPETTRWNLFSMFG